MHKKGVLLLIVIVLSMPLYASFQIGQSITYDFFLPQQAHVASLRTDFLWGGDEGLSGGMMLSLGWGLEHFTDYGSNALVYGPSLVTGPVVQFGFQSGLSFTAAAYVRATYALYPEVVRGGLLIDARYQFGERIFAGLGAGVLFPQWNANVQALFGVKV